jgi:hypothetical protein
LPKKNKRLISKKKLNKIKNKKNSQIFFWLLCDFVLVSCLPRTFGMDGGAHCSILVRGSCHPMVFVWLGVHLGDRRDGNSDGFEVPG